MVDIDKEQKVRVDKSKYPNGLQSKAGFYEYAVITKVYNVRTGELVFSEGSNKNKKE